MKQTLRDLLTTEVKYLIGVAVFVVGVASPYYDIKQDVALIKQNHYAHIEAINKEILEIKQEKAEDDKTMIRLMEEIAQLKYSK